MSHTLVVGMARSGVAAAAALVRRGGRVICTDLRADAPAVEGATCRYGEHRREDFVGASLIVVSPGVPAGQPDLAAAVSAGVPVVGELAWAAAQLSCPILAVSGTNGKSTTTHLLGQLCDNAGRRTFTGGNIGRPLSEALGGEHEIAAVEVSSYQMEFPGSFRPCAAAILNLTPDHLERHGTLDNYGAHKCRMFARMGPGERAIVPAGDPRLVRLANAQPGHRLFLGDRPGVRLREGGLELSGVPDPGDVSLEGFPLPGRHNRENLAAAVLLAVCGGLRRAELDVRRLRGLPHRMELVHESGGVRWIDDSKATNVDAALAACHGLEGPVIALLGGRGKAGAAYEALADALRDARAIVCFGEEGRRIADALALADLEAIRCERLADAVSEAARRARPGDTVLLSPACASFDEFTDFEHRGRVFAALAREA